MWCRRRLRSTTLFDCFCVSVRLFAPCFVVHETTGETHETRKKSNDGGGLTRVGTALTRAFGSFSNFVVNGAASPIGAGYVSVAGDIPERETRQGLGEAGYTEGRNVTVEYHILDGKFDRLPAVMDDLARRRVAVIAAPGDAPAVTARAATTTIPIAFAVSQDPVKLGLVASLARPGGNATGFNFFTQETQGKRLSLLHELVPKAVRVGVLVTPTNVSEATLGEVREAASALGLQIQVVSASTIGEINAAFAALARERADALFVTGGAFFTSRRVQLVTLAARDRIPAAYPGGSALIRRPAG